MPPVTSTPPPRYALWDRTPHPWGDADPAYGIHAWQDRQWRHDARTADFNAAADAHADPAPLAAEYTARVEALRRRAAPPPPERPDTAPKSRLDESLQVFAAQIPLILMVATLGSWTLVLLLVPLTLAVTLTVLYARSRRPIRRFINALDHRSCPDCDYDLTGIPPAFDFPAPAAIDPGPRACPECGSPWPLLPPPLHCPLAAIPPVRPPLSRPPPQDAQPSP